MKQDDFGNRMKDYESRTRYLLPRRTYTLVRLDGKSFHSYTKHCLKPFDFGLIEDLQETTKRLCEVTMGARIGYHQSDEITLLLTDFAERTTEAYFDNNLQKLTSILAAEATAYFNKLRILRVLKEDRPLSASDVEIYEKTDLIENMKMATFDCRVWTLSDPYEVENCFIWRENDATKNAISMAAYAVYSDEECKYKNSSEKQEMLFQKGINFNNYRTDAKRGACVIKSDSGWTIDREIPIFTQERSYLRSKIPLISNWISEAQNG